MMNTSELACPGCEAARNEVKALRFMPGCGSRLSLRSAGTTIVWSERRTNLRLHEMTAGVISLFPVVIYNEVCNSHVPAALSVQDFACALQRPSHRTGCRSIRAVLRRRVEPACVGAPIALPSEPRRRDSTRFFVRQAPAVRLAPTDSCDGGCAAGREPSRSL